MRGVRSENGHLACRSQPEAFQNLDRRGLAGTVRPQQREDLSAFDGEVQILQDVAFPVAHAQAAYGNRRPGRAARLLDGQG